MVSVLSREPDWNALPADTPLRVRELLRRCLRKDPERRLHDAADARLDIEDAGEAPAVTPSVAPRGRAISTRGWIVVAVATAGLGALAAWRLTRHSAPAPPSHPAISKLARITHDAGRSEGRPGPPTALCSPMPLTAKAITTSLCAAEKAARTST